jgi:hypothetical protein
MTATGGPFARVRAFLPGCLFFERLPNNILRTAGDRTYFEDLRRFLIILLHQVFHASFHASFFKHLPNARIFIFVLYLVSA